MEVAIFVMLRFKGKPDAMVEDHVSYGGGTCIESGMLHSILSGIA